MTKVTRRSPKAPPSSVQTTTDEAIRPDLSQAEAARYIAEFAAELSFMARRTDLDLLAYLLDMARLEAIRALQAKDRK